MLTIVQVLAVAQAIALTVSVECGLGVKEGDLEDEQRINTNKVRYDQGNSEPSVQLC